MDDSLPWKWKRLGIPLPENRKVTKFPFHVFWSIWNSHPSFWRYSYGTKSHFPILIFVKYNIKVIYSEIEKTWYIDLRKCSNFWCPYLQNNMFPGCSHMFFCFLKPFLYNQMSKYGLTGFGHPEIMKRSSFDVLNNEIWILWYQSEAGKSIKPLNLLFKYNFTIKWPKNAITILVIRLVIFLSYIYIYIYISYVSRRVCLKIARRAK